MSTRNWRYQRGKPSDNVQIMISRSKEWTYRAAVGAVLCYAEPQQEASYDSHSVAALCF